tara:strand:- start:2698 stop:4230 length:1533 start_codon:yes stop_codon:yes gene_type:complete
MRLLTSDQARFLDQVSIEEFGISSIDLMKNAGKRIASKAKEMINEDINPTILIFCGKGNNGGDGYAAASILHKDGLVVMTHSSTTEKDITNESLPFYRECVSLGIPNSFGTDIKDLYRPNLIIDGLLGIGLKGTVRPSILPLLVWINESSSKVLSIDVPSGLNSDTGTFDPMSVKADATLTFGAPKVGMYLRLGPEYCGDIIVGDIGFPSLDVVEFPGSRWRFNDQDIVQDHFHKPNNDISKHSAGKVLIIAGSRGMTGAAILSTYGALRSGAGLTITTSPGSLNEIYERSIIEGMTLSLDDDSTGIVRHEHYDLIMDKVGWADSVLLGPGLGRDISTQRLIKKLLISIDKPLVLDADGLFPFSANIEYLSKREHPLIITPHFGELARLMGEQKELIISEFPTLMNMLIEKFDQVCLVKQVPSCIVEGNNIRINTTGNPGLATAGTGDVLAGMITSLISQGLNCYDSASIGAYVHGEVSDHLISDKGFRGQIASDLLEHIPLVIRSYERS